ncbi:excinuclease ABC subunit UvrC [Kiloniella sp. b19]|uniref:excinuclease ABC subunit UvrC n=1 Tax=Kiloniella sp. GXU_MW_B19 TaxID=3141326 RepID=UPI0031E44B94
MSRLQRGQAIIRDVVRTLPATPGVYRMLDADGDALYVGKAKSLNKRVVSYTRVDQLPYRLKRMVSETRTMEIVHTKTEAEALLLESNLIKRLKPRYNVLLRDDKSFPYILLTGDHEAPMVTKHRGQQKRPGQYFGPFADARSVNQTITALEKAFLLRSCSDTIYAQRTRPCLMYQIKRCSAPCVGRVDINAYNELVQQAAEFLSGSSTDFQQKLAAEMQQAAEAMDYEKAAIYRDRIRALSSIQSRQDINVAELNNGDIFALHEQSGQSCIQVFFFRAGRNYGNRSYFPSHDKTLDSETVLTSFIAQFYANKPIPKQVLTSHDLPEQPVLAEALGQKAGQKIEVICPKRGARRKLMDNALLNAREALSRRLAESSSQKRLLEGLQELLELDKDTPLERVEVYDNSHTMGSEAYGGMIVAGPEGFMKKAYRKFKIRGDNRNSPRNTDDAQGNAVPFEAGDDYAMMREVLTRRLSRSLKEDPKRKTDQWPSLLMLDGGAGQLGVGVEVLRELGLTDIPIVAIAKGQDRNAGRERIFLPERPSFLVPPRDPVLYFIQRLRDEAHRFAIETHRKGRSNARLKSTLDSIPGIGSKRKKALMHHFGSADGVSRASKEDLETVEGISSAIAQKIYDFFNTE